MKSSLILSATLLGMLFVTAVPVQASPRAAEASGSHYLMAADNLDGWHLGGFYRYADREMDHGARSFKQNKFMMHIGRDLLPWVSIYGFLGSVTAEVEPGTGDNDPSLEYGAGIWANLLDHDLLNNLSLETRLRLQALFQVSAADPDVNRYDLGYTEAYGSLTLSIVNELLGNKNYWPDAIGLFFGPVYNELFMDNDRIDMTGPEFGITAGLDFYISRNLTLSVGYEFLDSDNAMNAALNFRF